MGGSRSDASQHTSTSTTTISDSYNSEINRVANLSDVGNVNLDFGSVDPEDGMPSISTFLLFGVLGVIALFVVGMMVRR